MYARFPAGHFFVRQFARRLRVGIGCGDHIGKAIDMARRLFEADARILKGPAPAARRVHRRQIRGT